MKRSNFSRTVSKRLSAYSLLAVLFCLFRLAPLLIADQQDDRAKLSWLNMQATKLYQAGKIQEALPVVKEFLELSENTLGFDDPVTATALNNLGELYRIIGEYAKAEPLYERALKVREKVLGPDHVATAQSLNNLALLYYAVGHYSKAEPLYKDALRIVERALGPDRRETAMILDNLAALYHSMGDDAQAEPLFQRALKLEEKLLGPDDPQTATTLNNLGLLYYSLGDNAKAEQRLQRALKIRAKVLGPDRLETATTLNNLGTLYRSMGHYARAEPFFQVAIEIEEKVLGPDRPIIAKLLTNLGALYDSMGNYAKGEELFHCALKIEEEALGSDHPDTAETLGNLGHAYHFMGDYFKAEPLFQRVLKIEEIALGPDHPKTGNALANLAELKIDLGKTTDAFSLASRARHIEEKHLSNILSFTSEQQRLSFQKTTYPYTIIGTLGSAPELAQTVLRQKGVVLDSLLEDRLVAEASADSKHREIIAQLRASKQRLMQLVLQVPKDVSETALKRLVAEKGRLSTEVEQLEAGLARDVAGVGKARRALNISVAQVQSVLPKEAVLIEFLRYSHYLGKTNYEDRYGAVLIFPGGEPKWVPLGAAVEIEKNVKLYQKSVRQKKDDGVLGNVLKALEERVWAPIEKALPEDSTTVILSPDGELSFVSFATLLAPEDRFLGEKYSFRYVASGRDLLRESKLSGNPTTVVFANPDFDSLALIQATASSSPFALRSMEMRDLQDVPLPALPGAAEEAAALERQSGQEVKIFLGPKATEAELRRVISPRILHLATHGFFLPELDFGKDTNALLQPIELGETNPLLQPIEIPKKGLQNPMYRSGLALAGAQSTLSAWGRGEVPPVENDGIVTAEEVGGLKLNGTWLVVLSACETGSGEARAGEGVMGLRRGFIEAGAENLLMTLWSINDRASVKVMSDFYKAADKNHNAPQALAEVQRYWLVKLRKDLGLRAAVKLAGPFIMSSQGKP